MKNGRAAEDVVGCMAEGYRILADAHGHKDLLNDELEVCHKAMKLDPAECEKTVCPVL